MIDLLTCFAIPAIFPAKIPRKINFLARRYLNQYVVFLFVEAERCLSFRYYMFGHTVDTLNVYISGTNKSNTVAWTKSGNQGSLWKYAQFTIEKMENLKVFSLFNKVFNRLFNCLNESLIYPSSFLSYPEYSLCGKYFFYSDQIIFEAIRGGDWSSDIALDDVVLSNSACSEGVSILHSFYILIVINLDAPR